MGNCIRHESSMQWGGDDWGATFSRCDYDKDDGSCDDVIVRGEIKGKGMGMGTQSSSRSTEVKIRISKKKLEEMLKKLDVKDKASVHKVISQLIRMSHHQQSWRPALNSISEI